MKQSLMQLTSLALVAAATACSFAARDAKMYEADTRALLETKSAEIKQCYDAVLNADPNVAGTVVVRFTVAEESGKIVDAAIVPEGTTAPDMLGQCVVQSISMLALQPGDANPGHATFTYEFTALPPPPAGPGPALNQPPPPAAPPG